MSQQSIDGVRDVLARACAAVTLEPAPQDWLETAATILAVLPSPSPGTPDPAGDGVDTTGDELAIVRRIIQLRAITEGLTTVAAERRADLAEIRHRIRDRALDALIDSPLLREPLQGFLAAWDLEPIPGEHLS